MLNYSIIVAQLEKIHDVSSYLTDVSYKVISSMFANIIQH